MAQNAENEMSPLAVPKKRRKRQRTLTARQAERALYVDFEGTARDGDDPVLLGVLYAPEGAQAWVLRRFVFDDLCAVVDLASGEHCEHTIIGEALGWLCDLSDSEKRHIVSWSRHDRDLIKAHTGRRAFRYRNAIATAKRWRRNDPPVREAIPTGPHTLARYEAYVGYRRPAELHGVADAIRYNGERRSVTPGAADRWRSVLAHNEHDLRAMRCVVGRALGH